ncbi:response regulator transcription factor [Tardiphaga robiniae]|uniref:DNA-binding response regulator n=1 Tax=Tardiphaga robiniae TaxID=943830 RepID=A0A164AHR6_9BRAD|nr:response regulator [Tardiphaga robiniae]KZD24827.1 DNA-binding response regulator [Tardiphaga robiniae]
MTADATTLRASTDKGLVFIVDDDVAVRRGLRNLFKSAGFNVEAFGSAAEMAQSSQSDFANCLVLDVRLPILDGIEIQKDLAQSNRQIPIIFITGHADVPTTIQAMKGGAVDFFTKPVDGRAILSAVAAAVGRDKRRREAEGVETTLLAMFSALTPREREVMTLVTSGLMNKQVAAELGLREITVKIHRGNIMKKMKAKSLPDLVRIADAISLIRT